MNVTLNKPKIKPPPYCIPAGGESDASHDEQEVFQETLKQTTSVVSVGWGTEGAVESSSGTRGKGKEEG